MGNTILQIIKVNPSYLDEIKPSFDELPESDHADVGIDAFGKRSDKLCAHALQSTHFPTAQNGDQK